MKKIYIAMAELEDGGRAFGNGYTTYQKAHSAALEMVQELETHMEWKVVPIVEEIDFIED